LKSVIRLLRKLARLSCGDLLALTEALVCVSAIRLAVWFVPFRYLRPAPSVAARHAADTDRLTRAVLAAAAVVPKSTCLVRAMAAQRLFARHGHASHLHIGVAQSVEEGFVAHAWLECYGAVLVSRSNTQYVSVLARSAGI
jgi:transglutaminase superfamily protein